MPKNNNVNRDKLIFLLFEYMPEDMPKAYCNNLDIFLIKYKEYISDDMKKN